MVTSHISGLNFGENLVQVMGRTKSDKLWGQLEKILECKPARYGDGKKYEVKLIGVDQTVWVHQKDLSKGVQKNYEADGGLIKGARALVNRGFVDKQNKYFSKVISFISCVVCAHLCMCHVLTCACFVFTDTQV